MTSANAMRFIGKELMVAVINGVGFAAMVAVVTLLWFGDPALAMVIAVAMVGNLFMAGLAGALIPLALDRLNIDPANASAVVLTTITDIVGFFAFLGLASWILL